MAEVRRGVGPQGSGCLSNKGEVVSIEKKVVSKVVVGIINKYTNI